MPPAPPPPPSPPPSDLASSSRPSASTSPRRTTRVSVGASPSIISPPRVTQATATPHVVPCRWNAQREEEAQPRVLRRGLDSAAPMVLVSCLCCLTQLRHPATVRSFKCVVCGYTGDHDGLPYRGKPLQLSHVQTLLAADNLAAFEKAVFSAWCTFAGPSSSFVDSRNRPDLPSLRAFYRLVLSAPERAQRAVLGAQDNALRRPGCKDSEEWGQADTWGLVVILENPILRRSPEPLHALTTSALTRLFGLVSNLPNSAHHHLVSHFSSASSYPAHSLAQQVEVVGSFIAARLRKHLKALGRLSVWDEGQGALVYADDWKLRSAAKMMALLFAANDHSRVLPISHFYSTLTDALPLAHDYAAWSEKQRGFALGQYPFLITLGGKIEILTHDARQQMQARAHAALLSTVVHRKLTLPFLHLHIRRTHLVEDSLNQMAANKAELKKALRVEFVGEPGVDAGGVRKEWFLLLSRKLFDPSYGMFTAPDPASHLLYFNPASPCPPSEFFLVGAIVGLAAFHTITLDIPLPRAVYRKLLRQDVGLRELAEWAPELARGLRRLLEWDESRDGSVESVLQRRFVGEYEAFGEVVEVPLVPGGADKPVTASNRREFVELYTDFLLSKSISTQFEAFRKGFLSVCGGNALSLFRAEEVELLVRGAEDELNVEQLKNMTVYEGFSPSDSLIQAFWRHFASRPPTRQRKLLAFVTGSDRIPATGLHSLALRIVRLGGKDDPDTERLPSSRTCFNTLCLYRYATPEKMIRKLEAAVALSEGFGLK